MEAIIFSFKVLVTIYLLIICFLEDKHDYGKVGFFSEVLWWGVFVVMMYFIWR